jgi:probable HAF family extracellular repeat protein
VGKATQEDFNMRKRRPFPLSVSSCLLAGLVVASIPLASCGQGTGSATRGTPSFTSFDFPGSTETVPFKLNANGDIVGLYLDSLKKPHGFLLQGQSFSTVDFPGAVDNDLKAINDSTETTGDYDDSSGLTHGFLRQPDGSVVTIDPPASGGYTEANGINNSGTIVGRYFGNSGDLHGFQFSNGNYSTIDVPGATGTSVFGINNLGDIVGAYKDTSGATHGFLLSNGSVTTIDFPGSTNTNAQGINDSGEIVGSTVVGNVRHGYLFSNGHFTQIDFPGASLAGSGAPLSGTDVHGINTSGVIVGSYTDSAGVIHGFVTK